MSVNPFGGAGPVGRGSRAGGSSVTGIVATALDITDGTEGGAARGTFSQVGDVISFTLTDDTIGNFPDTCRYVEFALAADVDLTDIWRAIILCDLIPVADMWVGIALLSADVQRGLCWRIQASGTDWIVAHSGMTAGTWGAYTVGTADADTLALLAVLQGVANGTTTARFNSVALGVLGESQLGTTATSPSANAVGNDFTKLRLCVGSILGATVPEPTTISFKAAVMHEKIVEIPGFDTLFP